MNDKLNDSLGLASVAPQSFNPPAVLSNDAGDHSEAVECVNDNLHNAIELSKQAVQEMIVIAGQSQHPKAYEVLNAMIKTYAEMSMGLVDLQLKKQRLEKNSQQSQPGDTINNNLIVASTADIQRMLEDFKEQQED